MKSWTRTLNLDDAHTLLALAEKGRTLASWSTACHAALPELSPPRRRELIRILRDQFLDWTQDERVADGLFLRVYSKAPASAQLDLVDVQWALSHPLTLLATEKLVAPALRRGDAKLPLPAVEAFVAQHLVTESAESLRKTRTVLLGAMEGVGTLVTRGTGQHRSLAPARGNPHPVAFAYLVLRELAERKIDGMLTAEAIGSSLPVRLTQCTEAQASACLDEASRRGWLVRDGDEVRA